MAVERGRVERLAEEGSRRARRVLRALRTLSFQLSGAQLGITLSSLLLGFIAEPAVAVVLRPLVEALPGVPERSALGVSVALALGLATVAQMVLGELVPKNLAIARPLAAAMAIAAPMQWVNGLLRPLILFLNESANWTVRRIGIEPLEELTGVRSLEELELLVQSSEGEIDDTELALLVRSFDFPEATASDVMVPRVEIVALARDDSLVELVRVALESGHSRFPVHAGHLDEIVGVVHVKDVLRIPPGERTTTPVGRVAQEPLVVPEARPLDDLLVDMQREGKHLAVVVDEYGGTAGIVTVEDLLEEIVGEIEDEHDRSAELAQVGEGVWTVPGLLHRGELREMTGFELPEGRFETLGGFLLSRLGRFPREGDRVAFEGWTFVVEEMEGHRIGGVMLVPPPTQEGDEE